MWASAWDRRDHSPDVSDRRKENGKMMFSFSTFCSVFSHLKAGTRDQEPFCFIRTIVKSGWDQNRITWMRCRREEANKRCIQRQGVGRILTTGCVFFFVTRQRRENSLSVCVSVTWKRQFSLLARKFWLSSTSCFDLMTSIFISARPLSSAHAFAFPVYLSHFHGSIKSISLTFFSLLSPYILFRTRDTDDGREGEGGFAKATGRLSHSHCERVSLVPW